MWTKKKLNWNSKLYFIFIFFINLQTTEAIIIVLWYFVVLIRLHFSSILIKMKEDIFQQY